MQSEKNLPQCHFVDRESHKNSRGTEPEDPVRNHGLSAIYNVVATITNCGQENEKSEKERVEV
jgi:hypothetical protein